MNEREFLKGWFDHANKKVLSWEDLRGKNPELTDDRIDEMIKDDKDAIRDIEPILERNDEGEIKRFVHSHISTVIKKNADIISDEESQEEWDCRDELEAENRELKTMLDAWEADNIVDSWLTK